MFGVPRYRYNVDQLPKLLRFNKYRIYCIVDFPSPKLCREKRTGGREGGRGTGDVCFEGVGGEEEGTRLGEKLTRQARNNVN